MATFETNGLSLFLGPWSFRFDLKGCAAHFSMDCLVNRSEYNAAAFFFFKEAAFIWSKMWNIVKYYYNLK